MNAITNSVKFWNAARSLTKAKSPEIRDSEICADAFLAR